MPITKIMPLTATALLLSACIGSHVPVSIRYPGVPLTEFVSMLCRYDAGLGAIPKKPNEYFSPDGSFFLRWIEDPYKAYFGPKNEWCADRTTGSGTTLTMGNSRCLLTSITSRVVPPGLGYTPKQLFEMELDERRQRTKVEIVTAENVDTPLGPAYLAVLRLHGSAPCSTYRSKGVTKFIMSGPEVFLMGYWLRHGNYGYRLSHQEAEAKMLWDRSTKTYVPAVKPMGHTWGFRRRLDGLLDIFHPRSWFLSRRPGMEKGQQ